METIGRVQFKFWDVGCVELNVQVFHIRHFALRPHGSIKLEGPQNHAVRWYSKSCALALMYLYTD